MGYVSFVEGTQQHPSNYSINQQSLAGLGSSTLSSSAGGQAEGVATWIRTDGFRDLWNIYLGYEKKGSLVCLGFFEMIFGFIGFNDIFNFDTLRFHKGHRFLKSYARSK